MFLAGFDLSEDSAVSNIDVLNDTLGINLTVTKVHTVELMGMQCGKECYAISIAVAVTFLAGVYQVKNTIIFCVFCFSSTFVGKMHTPIQCYEKVLALFLFSYFSADLLPFHVSDRQTYFIIIQR